MLQSNIQYRPKSKVYARLQYNLPALRDRVAVFLWQNNSKIILPIKLGIIKFFSSIELSLPYQTSNFHQYQADKFARFPIPANLLQS
jgi:hypothetical protein